jgi:anthranilate phosphoribosyltransferase
LFLDELSTLGVTTIAEFYQDRGFAVSQLTSAGFPVQPTDVGDLRGGDRATNADIVRRILRGEEQGPKREAVLLNAAAALLAAGRAGSMTEGWDLAAETIDRGLANAKLAALTRRA